MNITDKFDLYFENKLSESEKMKFESELNNDAELYESYKAYFLTNRILENELSSPAINYESDPILKDLNSIQRLEIEETFIRFHDNEAEYPYENKTFSPKEGLFDASNDDIYQAVNDNANTRFDEVRFREILNSTSSNKTPGRLIKIGQLIGIAAAIFISLFSIKLIYTHYFTNLKKISPQQAYTLYYSPGTDKELNSLSFNDTRLNSAFLDIKRSNNGSDSIFLNQMRVSDEDYELSLLFLGIIHMERNDYPGARTCFTHIISLKDPKKINSVNFYMSLSYLYEGNFQQAESFLIKLSDNKNPYKKEAKKILKNVKH